MNQAQAVSAVPEIPRARAVHAASDQSLENLKAIYLQHLGLKNYSDLSIRQNNQALRFFLIWLEEQGIDSIHRVGKDEVEKYKAVMSAQKSRTGALLTPDTVRNRLIVVQCWFEFLRKKGVVQVNPVKTVRMPKHVRRLPKQVLSIAEVRKIMAQPNM